MSRPRFAFSIAATARPSPGMDRSHFLRLPPLAQRFLGYDYFGTGKGYSAHQGTIKLTGRF